jgi:hypothetical protein
MINRNFNELTWSDPDQEQGTPTRLGIDRNAVVLGVGIEDVLEHGRRYCGRLRLDGLATKNPH